MPLYEYKCENCGERFEVIRRPSDKDEVKCPTCDEKAKKLLSGFSVGSGSRSSSETGASASNCGWGGG